MAEKRWRFMLDETPHAVELEHSTFMGKRSIRVDGLLLTLEPLEKKQLRETGSHDAFRIQGHACVVRIVPHGRQFAYTLEVDDVAVSADKSDELQQEDLDELSGVRWVLSSFFVLIGLGAGWYNWNLAHTTGLYSREIAFLAPIPITLALYIFFFPRDFMKQMRGGMSAITLVFAVVMILVAIAHVYIFENIGY